MTEIEETKDLVRKLVPVLGGKARALWYLNITSKDAKAAFGNKELLRILADRNAKVDYQENVRLPPPSPDQLSGEYAVGKVVYPEADYGAFGLREDEFIKHILIVGMTGSGKTNLVYQLLTQLTDHNKPFLVFDWKRNYRCLQQLAGFERLRSVRLGHANDSFRFNPLIPPPGVHPKNWLALLVDVMKHAFFVAHGVEFFFRKGIDHLYNQFHVYDGASIYPTFSDLQKVLQKEFVRGREMLWMSSAKRVLASLTFSGLLGEVLNVRTQPPIEALLNEQVILELDNLATIEKIFFVESLLLWIYHFRKGEANRETFKHTIVLEEAHHILSGRKEILEGEETIIETVIRMIREFGVSVIAVDQEPSKLSNSILANTNCKICFNLGNGRDISTISRCMSLKPGEQDFIDKLKVGHAIIKMKERFSAPIHVGFPLVPIDKNRSIGIP
jgi:hypothetical protein